MVTETVAAAHGSGRADVPGDALRAALTRAALDQSGSALVLGTLCLLVCAALLRGAVDGEALALWLGAGLAIAAARLPLLRRSRDTDLARPFAVLVALVVLSGANWGALALFWSPALAPETRLVIALFTLALALGAVTAYGARRILFFAFAVPAQLPLIVVFARAEESSTVALALPTTLFLLGQTVLIQRYHRRLRDALALELGNAALAADLASRERALADARGALERANAAKAEFLARMSHEIRTPMNGVLGSAELLGHTALAPDQARLLGTLRDSGETLLGLIDRLLDVSAIESGRLTLAPRTIVLEEALAGPLARGAAAAAARGLAFERTHDPRLPARLHGDPLRLAQLVGHLIDNAVRFTEEGGVSVRAALVDTEPGAAPHWRLTVSDTGPGIDAADREAVFERFRQLDGSSTRRVGGSGLGLSIVRELVALMDGTIALESASGAGSTFTVTLPLVAVRAPAAPVAAPATDTPVAATPADVAAGVPATGAADAPTSFSVLVAEDNPVNQLVIESMLEALGCAVRVADDGAEALEALAEERFDIVFMDCQMPRVDGLEATREARARGHALPIVAVTANAMAGDRERCIAAGMDDYVSKPFTAETIAAMLGRWAHGAPESLPEAA